jgi:ABC-type sugar transport system ATPase subunit
VEEKDDSLAEQPVLTNEDLVIGVRPEYLKLSPDGELTGEMYGVMPTGMESTIKIAVGNYLLTGVIFGSELYQIGQKHAFSMDGDNILLFDRKSGRYIAAGTIRVE